MKYRSQIVTAASGSVGGCTYSRNRYGPYIRNRSMPVNPSSYEQSICRGALATLVARWTSVLTPAERTAWDTWAINTPQVDKLGNPITITGQNAFIKMNAARIQVGALPINVAPTVYAGAAITPPYAASATAATETLSIVFNNADDWATKLAGHLLVYVARPQNPSKLFFSGPYRFMDRIDGAVVPPTSPKPIISTFPFAVGQRIHCRFVAIQADARISTAHRYSVIAI